jgi:RNA polymerase sigma-70 factor (ECF subfamily)
MTTPHQQTSSRLLQRVQARDPDAWRRLVALYTPLVRYWCRQWGVDDADADDLCQDVFQGVATGVEAFRRDRAAGTFRGWLRGITRHKLLDHRRRQRQRPIAAGGTDAYLRFLDVPEEDLPALEETEAEVTGLYRRALETVRGDFEEQTWQAFWRTAVGDEAAPDVAAALGMSAAAVRKARSRVLHRLKEEVGDLIA